MEPRRVEVEEEDDVCKWVIQTWVDSPWIPALSLFDSLIQHGYR
jgi:hypothetical protein